METPKIPATVSVLTKNSAHTLERALKSVAGFAEIIVCDGGSTDATLDIAHLYGARILGQDDTFKDSTGRLIDFSGARNACLAVATYPWHAYVDSDEYFSQELVDEIRSVVGKNTPAAYWVPRHYVWEGKEIMCSPSYPNQQIRFFHADVVTAFRKPIHERIMVKEGTQAGVLSSCLLVPITDSLTESRTKTNRYIALEISRQKPITIGKVYREWRTALRTLVRFLWRSLATTGCVGARLPFAREWEGVRYQYMLALASLRALFARP